MSGGSGSGSGTGLGAPGPLMILRKASRKARGSCTSLLVACSRATIASASALPVINRYAGGSLIVSERTACGRSAATVRVPDEVCVVTEQRCYIPSILLKIRPHFRGRALAVAPAIEDLQSPAFPERSLLLPRQGTVDDAAVCN